MIINTEKSSFGQVFEDLPIGCALDLMRSDLMEKRKEKIPILNSRRSLQKRGIINRKQKLTKKAKETYSF